MIFFNPQESPSSPVPSLVALDATQPGFVKDLEALDTTNNRTVDTVHVFYVRTGQRHSRDILDNVVCFIYIFLSNFYYAMSVYIFFNYYNLNSYTRYDVCSNRLAAVVCIPIF